MGTSHLLRTSGYCTVQHRKFHGQHWSQWEFSWQWAVPKCPWRVTVLEARPLTSQKVDQGNSTQCPACGESPSHCPWGLTLPRFKPLPCCLSATQGKSGCLCYIKGAREGYWETPRRKRGVPFQCRNSQLKNFSKDYLFLHKPPKLHNQ